jgi:hypothetical protein
MRSENEPTRISGIPSSRMPDRPPLAVGTKVEPVAALLDRRVEYVLGVVEHDPRPDRDGVAQGPAPRSLTYAFEVADGGTQVRPRGEGEQGRCWRVAEPLVTGRQAGAVAVATCASISSSSP